MLQKSVLCGGFLLLQVLTSDLFSDTDPSLATQVDPGFSQPDFTPAGATQIPSLGISFSPNIIYSQVSGDVLEMDIYLPNNASPSHRVPGIIYLHGGGWNGGDKSEANPKSSAPSPFSPLLADLRPSLPSQFAIISINYRLTVPDPANGIVNAAGFPQNLRDVKTAIQWIKSKANKYIDPDNLVVWGFSAGGHLAAMVGTTEGNPDFAGRGPAEVSSSVKAVLGVSPPVDLSVLTLQFYTNYLNTLPTTFCASALADARADMLSTTTYTPSDSLALLLSLPLVLPLSPTSADSTNQTDPATEEAITIASPITYVTAQSAPMLFFTGSCDAIVPIVGMDNFTTKAGNVHKTDTIITAGYSNNPDLVERVIAPYQDHGDALNASGVSKIVQTFLSHNIQIPAAANQ